MNKEVKEIIEALKPLDDEFKKEGLKDYPLYLSVEERIILLDYITSLEQENERLNNIVETLKTEVFNGIMGFQGEGSFSLGSRTAYQFIYNRINELMDLKGSDK